MGERIEFICLGDRLLSNKERAQAVEDILNGLSDFAPSLTTVMVLRIREHREERREWSAGGAELVSTDLSDDDLLFVYFDVTGAGPSGSQNLSFSCRFGKTVVELSFLPETLLGSAGKQRPEHVFGQLATWSMQTFDHGLLFYGVELDLYELHEEKDLEQMEKLLANDWRCVGTCSTRRLRILSGVLSP